jgi:hypothetical protein
VICRISAEENLPETPVIPGMFKKGIFEGRIAVKWDSRRIAVFEAALVHSPRCN